MTDEDLDGMHLSDKKNEISRNRDHEDLEVLLEAFHKRVEEVVNEVGNIELDIIFGTFVHNFDTDSLFAAYSQEIVELILDSNRNALLSLNLQWSYLITGLFGMNVNSLYFINNTNITVSYSLLTNRIKSHPYAFYGMTGDHCGLSAFIAVFAGFRKLTKTKGWVTWAEIEGWT
ncbi:hypothetical protein K435DRAFT_880767 [Dendrothele bispora CBS 962.96]|uniref:Uncharacterized protein n=1 Tax=Dendrothele bispora (strain CBS 962.96) TaxID=1314807 RepID=A0A4S8KJA2_DENBC|nr:hypothetical protein K435DRAFT_880767 [Dendrothele bispora CBS 962.96]